MKGPAALVTLPSRLRAAWRRDTPAFVIGGIGAFILLAFVIFLAVAIPLAIREERALAAMTPAERAVLRHVMPDGTICYQPREGWSRPLSCVRRQP